MREPFGAWRDGRPDMLSFPIKLDLAGWRADTWQLQQAGWAFSADQDIRSRTMQLAFEHKQMGLRGISARIDFEYLHQDQEYLRHVVLPAQAMGREVFIHMHGSVPSLFQPIDAKPQLVEHRRVKLEDYVHFAPALVRTQEIILPEESVEELMERILKLQQPARTERYQRLAREAGDPGQQMDFAPRHKVHAQIISLAA
ncbi:hypothetical protein [Roseixanthobacter pseudopolyaromaticivorans]|uniref:hypothetical protein n=1 Tax=Xanthobacteraceae TaxID=335928 RepID=UPI00372BCD10